MGNRKALTLLLAIVAPLLFVDVAQAYYTPGLGRFISRDPYFEQGFELVGGARPLMLGQVELSYVYVRNGPVDLWDYLGLMCASDDAVKCEGVCGAIVDDWIMAEINAQQEGLDKWKKDHPNFTIEDYLKWANGNQRYKDPDNFKFSEGADGCGTQPNKDKPGCGRSVTLCGKCVRSAILGNVMYGLIGARAGFTQKQLKDGATSTKKDWGMTVDEYDERAYQLGVDLYNKLKDMKPPDFCKAFEAVVGDASALREGRKGGGYNDLGSCTPCTKKTKETRHGGSESPRRTP